MAVYKSVQDIIDSTEKKEIREKLKALDVEHHHAESVQSLAEKLFNAQSDGGTVVEVATKATDDDFFAKLAAEAETKGANKRPDKKSSMATFVSKNHNFWESAKGLDKDGRHIRYVSGFDTLDIKTQEDSGVVFKVDPIRFRGLDHPLPDDPFNGRGVLRTKDEALKEYIRTNKNFGTKYNEYAPEELRRTKLREQEKINSLQHGVFSADYEDLVMIVSFMDLQRGSDTFESLYSNSQRDTLLHKCLAYINNDTDNILEAMKGKMSKVIFMINKAKLLGKIKVTSDGTDVQWASNGSTICRSSRTSNWQHDLFNYLATPEGRLDFDKLSTMTGVTFK